MMKAFVMAWCWLLAVHGLLYAQSGAQYFGRAEYKAGAQNWGIQQDASGIMYIANNEGLLTYDGASWQLYPLPNHTILRSIALHPDGRLYAGGQDEFGYFEANGQGKLVYHSLVPQVDQRFRQFADIWHIAFIHDQVFFQSFTTIFRLQGMQLQAYPARTKWEYLGTEGTRMYAQESTSGLLTFNGQGWDVVIGAAAMPSGVSITTILPYAKGLLLATARHGLWTLLPGSTMVPSALNAVIGGATPHYTAASLLPQGHILLGTYHSGLYHLDSSGALLATYNTEDGLGNNNVKCIFTDRYGFIWLGLDDGIALVDLHASIRQLNPAIFNGAPGYAATVQGNTLYMALGSGLYAMPLAGIMGSRLATTGIQKLADGLTWNVMTVDGQVWAGKDDGLFRLQANQLLPVDKSTGYWNLVSVGIYQGQPLFAGGNYFGVSFFTRQATGGFSKLKSLPSFTTSSRYLAYDSSSNCLWISHPYRGIYKVQMPQQKLEYFTSDKGLPSVLNNHIFPVKGTIAVATLQGLYHFNTEKKAFEQHTRYAAAFRQMPLRYLKEDDKGHLWFVTEKVPGVLDAANQQVYLFPELQRKIKSGFEHILPLDSQHIVLGGEQGFYILNYNRYLQQNIAPQVYIRQVSGTLHGDSIIAAGYGKGIGGAPELSHKWKEIVFTYAAPYSMQSPYLTYSHRLRGLNDTWSAWGQKTEKSYAQLPPGKYVFEVKARNNLYAESEVVSYAFEVLAPWYKTTLARLLYLVLLVMALLGLLRRREAIMKARHKRKMDEAKARYEEQQKIQAYSHQLELEKNEKELIRLQNEKLESELAATAMNLVQKKEFLHKLREEINKIKNSAQENIDPADLKKLVKDLTAEDRLNEEWEQFSMHFNSVHNNFLVTLKDKFPQLSAHDLKLCAYLRMNLSSKEMARLMSISIRGVEINRYRLRKKLQLQPKENLFEFFLTIEKEGTPSANSTQVLRDLKPD